MHKKVNRKTAINVRVTSKRGVSPILPKEIILYDSGYEVISHQWIQGNFVSLGEFCPGVYMVQMIFPSGEKHEKIFKLDGIQPYVADFDLIKSGPEENMAWAYYNKRSALSPKKKDFSIRMPVTIGLKFWKFDNQRWIPDPDIGGHLKDIIIHDENGVQIFVETGKKMSLLELSFPKYPQKSICLPPGGSVNVLIRPVSNAANPGKPPIDVIVATDNIKAEALLTLLHSGNIERASSLMPVSEAEKLLEEKRRDVSAAAIGGYYLLRCNAFEQLHDWPRNLANWFPYLPDGAVIYATQLLNTENPSPEIIAECRKYLIAAILRGIPIYTEGVRLLIDGLTVLSSFELGSEIINDSPMKAALKIIDFYRARIDWSQDVTTFNELGNTLQRNKTGSTSKKISYLEEFDLAHQREAIAAYQSLRELL